MDKETKQALDDHEKRITELESKFQSEPEVTEKPISLKEFLISKNPKGAVNKTLVIAYYLEKHKGNKNFTVKELESGFREAREKVPKNINDKIYQNIKKGYMDEAEKKNNRKSYYLTTTGESFVRDKLKK